MGSNKRLTINLISNIISYSTTMIIAFILTPYLINELGKEAYSFYPMANNFVQYMSIITVALNSMSSTFITIEISRKKFEQANIYFSSVFYSNIIMAIVLLIPMIIIVIFLDSFINIPVNLIPSIKILFSLVFLSMIINILTSVFSIAVFAKNRIDLRSIGDIFQAILKIVLYIIFFFFFKPSIIYVGLVALILSITYFFIHSIYTRKLLPEMHISLSYFDVNAIKEVLASGIWNSISQIGSTLLFSLSILYCNVLVSVQAAGEYAIIQTIPNFINGVISMLTAVFMPVITQTYATKSINDVIMEIYKSQKIMGMITNIPIAVFMCVGYEFYTLWVPNEDAHKLYILTLFLIFHLIIIGVTWTIFNLNTVINKVKVPAIYMVLSGIVNFILVLILTKFTNLGIWAIVFSSFFILVIWSGVFIPIYPCMVLKLKYLTFYPAIFKSLISSVFIFIVTIGVKNAVSINGWFDLFIVCGISGFIGLIINFLLILDKNEKQNILKKIYTKAR